MVEMTAEIPRRVRLVKVEKKGYVGTFDNGEYLEDHWIENFDGVEPGEECMLSTRVERVKVAKKSLLRKKTIIKKVSDHESLVGEGK